MSFPKATNILRGAVRREGYTDTRFSRATGIPMATLQYRYRNPGTWRVYEIGTILRLVDFNESELKGMKEALLS